MNISTSSSSNPLVGGTRATGRPANAAGMSCHEPRKRGAVARVARFLWHFAQMVVAMQLGMMLFHALLCQRLSGSPLLHELVMDFYMTAPMVAVMVWHGHCWRHSAEMAAAMLAGPLILIACVQLHLGLYVPWFSPSLASTLSGATMYLGMVAAMLYRREVYAA